MGHDVDTNPLTQKVREESEYGFADEDIPLLKTLRILKVENGQLQVNKKLAPSRSDIMEFLHWTTGDRKAPLPPIARRILCLKRAIIINSVRSIQTGNLQRTGEHRQLEEIDALLRSDGVVNLDGETCATENSKFVGGVPAASVSTTTTTGPGCSTVVNCDSTAVTSMLEDIKKAIDDLKEKAPAGKETSAAAVKLEKLKEGIDALNTRVNDTASDDEKHAKIIEMLAGIKALLEAANANVAANNAQFDEIAENAAEQTNKNIDRAHMAINEKLRVIDEKVTTIGSDSKNTKSGVNTIKEDLEFLKDAVGKIKCCEGKDAYIAKLIKALEDAGVDVPSAGEAEDETSPAGNAEGETAPADEAESETAPADEAEGETEGEAEGETESEAEGMAAPAGDEGPAGESGPHRERLVVENAENELPAARYRNSGNNYDSDTSLPPQQRGKKPSTKRTEGDKEETGRERLVIENAENELPAARYRNSGNNYDSDTSLPLQQRGKKPSTKRSQRDEETGPAVINVENAANELPEARYRNSGNDYDSDTSLPLQQRGKKPFPKRKQPDDESAERVVAENNVDEMPEPHYHNSGNENNIVPPFPQQRGKKPFPKRKPITITGPAEELSGDDADVSNNETRASYEFPPNNEERVRIAPVHARGVKPAKKEEKAAAAAEETKEEKKPVVENKPETLNPKSKLYKGLIESIKLEGYGKITNKAEKIHQLENLVYVNKKKNRTYPEVKALVDEFLKDFGEKGTLKTRVKYYSELLKEDTWPLYIDHLIDSVMTITEPPKTRKAPRGRKLSNRYTRKYRR